MGFWVRQTGIRASFQRNRPPSVKMGCQHHLFDVTRTLMAQMKVPQLLWTDAVLIACHLINRMPSSVHGNFPHCLLFPQKPLFSLPPKVFGCVCFVQGTRPNLDKLSPRSTHCMFVGYSRTQKEYRCYDPVSSKYLVSADVTFFKDTPFSSSTSYPSLPIPLSVPVTESVPLPEPTPLTAPL